MRKLTHEELLSRQQVQSTPKIPLTVIVNNVRSLYNVGSLFRTADGAGIEKVWLCGITGIPPAGKISKTALGAQNAVNWEYSRTAIQAIEKERARGYKIVLLEQTAESVSYEDYIPDGPTCIVIGNEISGVADELLPYCDKAIEIEMAGLKNSLNVTVALGVIAYHFRRFLKSVPVKG